MPDGSEFQTAGDATLKPRDAKLVRTQGTDNSLAFAEHICREVARCFDRLLLTLAAFDLSLPQQIADCSEQRGFD